MNGRIWVVEIFKNGVWTAAADVGSDEYPATHFSRTSARGEAAHYRRNGNRTRIRQYQRVEPRRKGKR